MSHDSLRARIVRHVPSLLGKEAVLVLVEPNGDEHQVRCLVKEDGTDVAGNGESLEYLNARYGSQTVSGVARRTVLSEEPSW